MAQEIYYKGRMIAKVLDNGVVEKFDPDVEVKI